MTREITRRAFVGSLASLLLLGRSAAAREIRAPLMPTSSPGVLVRPGFAVREVARSGVAPVAGAMPWVFAPDGGATFARPPGGFVYVANAELASGGAAALEFDAQYQMVDAYSILSGTRRNCAGGATPWSTWLSCEEVVDGMVYECDPFGLAPAVPRPSLGVFCHEAVAFCAADQAFYLTEDMPDGRLYRFRSTVAGDLAAGVLEVATCIAVGAPANGPAEWSVSWSVVPDASAAIVPTRYQVPASTPFNGGEGISVAGPLVHFATKGDDTVYTLDVASNTLRIAYRAADSKNPTLRGVDNVLVRGETIFVAEDGDDLQIVALEAGEPPLPIAQLAGHDGSEMTGLAFSPDGSRLYFSSQRGSTDSPGVGVTYEMSGPFDDVIARNGYE